MIIFRSFSNQQLILKAQLSGHLRSAFVEVFKEIPCVVYMAYLRSVSSFEFVANFANSEDKGFSFQFPAILINDKGALGNGGKIFP